MEKISDYKEAITKFMKETLHLAVRGEVKDTASKVTAFIEIPNDYHYGIVFNRLEKNNKLELLDDNQLVTEQGSSIVYTTKEAPYYIVTLLADYLNERYSLNISLNKEK